MNRTKRRKRTGKENSRGFRGGGYDSLDAHHPGRDASSLDFGIWISFLGFGGEGKGHTIGEMRRRKGKERKRNCDS